VLVCGVLVSASSTKAPACAAGCSQRPPPLHANQQRSGGMAQAGRAAAVGPRSLGETPPPQPVRSPSPPRRRITLEVEPSAFHDNTFVTTVRAEVATLEELVAAVDGAMRVKVPMPQLSIWDPDFSEFLQPTSLASVPEPAGGGALRARVYPGDVRVTASQADSASRVGLLTGGARFRRRVVRAVRDFSAQTHEANWRPGEDLALVHHAPPTLCGIPPRTPCASLVTRRVRERVCACASVVLVRRCRASWCCPLGPRRAVRSAGSWGTSSRPRWTRTATTCFGRTRAWTRPRDRSRPRRSSWIRYCARRGVVRREAGLGAGMARGGRL
jgi:hypothetical protein